MMRSPIIVMKGKYRNMLQPKTVDLSTIYRDITIIGHTGKLEFNLESEVCNNSIKLWYNVKSGQQPNPINLVRFIPLDKNTLVVFGLIQAECGKSELKEFVFSNSNPELILLIINYLEKTWKISRSLWNCFIYFDKDKLDDILEDQIKVFWTKLLNINKEKIKIYRSTKKCKTSYGVAQIRMYNKTFLGVILHFLNKIVKPLVEEDSESCGYYLRGLLSGDGFLSILNNKISYFGISFNPYSDEKGHYVKLFENAGIIPNKSSLKEGSRQLAFSNWDKYCKLLQLTKLQPFIENNKNMQFFKALIKHPYAKRMFKLKELFEIKKIITVNDYQKALNVSNRWANRNLVKFVELDILERSREGRKDFYTLTENGKKLFKIFEKISGDQFEK